MTLEGPDPLDSIFYPKSVAVLGVTKTPGTVPHDIFQNILRAGYTGVLYPVAPGKVSISAVKAYRYVIDIDGDVDLAVIVYPANVVERALEQCGQKGVKAVIVISAGFREVGPAGVEREQRVKAICDKYNMAMIGPNCLGVINTDPKVVLDASFARKTPSEGRIAFLSQSGALCTAVLDYARARDIGFSKFVSFGNKAGVNEIDLLHYLHRDPKTDVILLYLEELRDGRGLVAAAKAITRGDDPKPIILIKSGRTPQGADAASSHTGSLAGEDSICGDVFRDAGVVRVSTLDEMFNTAVMLTNQPMPKGNRLAIVTNAGGPGVMATDAAVGMGIEIARFEPDTTDKLRAALPDAANVKNPVDVIGDARSDRYEAAVKAVLDDPNVDQALVILTPQSMTDIDAIARGVVKVHETTDKLMACSFMGAFDVVPGVGILQKAGIPHYILPEHACSAMADVQGIRRWRGGLVGEKRRLPVDKAAAEAILDAAPEGYLPEDQALTVLKAYGFPVKDFKLCADAAEAVKFADKIGYPVVLRVVSPDIVHKFDVKGVALDIEDAESLRGAHQAMMDNVKRAIPDAKIAGVVVRGMIPVSHEVILGAKRDRAFGQTLMFGLGGLFVEIFKDVTFALAPISCQMASRMVRAVKAYGVLDGARGTKRADIEGIEDCLLRLSQLVDDFRQIAELDINPLLVGPGHGACAVADVRIRIDGGE